MRCAHTDWIGNTLTVTGPVERLEALRAAAAGAGVTPWAIDYDRLEEDLRVRMLAMPRPQRQTSLEGCRIVARQMRDFVWDGHEEAVAAVGVLRHVPFDLHSLVPVPWKILRLGDEDPKAIAWLWDNWGTTWTLRRVTTVPLQRPGWCVEFWSADWTPWPVIDTLRRRYPGLKFGLQVDTGLEPAQPLAPKKDATPPRRLHPARRSGGRQQVSGGGVF